MLVTAVVAAVMASGCALVELSPEAQEDAYLLRVASAEAPWVDGIERFDNILSSAFSSRDAFARAVFDAQLDDAAAESLAAAEALEPPQSLQADHDAWLAFRRAVIDLEPQLVEAVATSDTAGVLEIRRAFGEIEADFLLSISRLFCLHLQGVNPAEHCPAGDDLPGGDYGKAAFEVLREYGIRVGPLFRTSPNLTPDERSDYLTEVQPEIEVLLQQAWEGLDALTPPPELSADHQALLTYFAGQHATAMAITTANKIRDDAAISQLYEQSGALFQDLQSSLSETVRPIVDPAF